MPYRRRIKQPSAIFPLKLKLLTIPRAKDRGLCRIPRSLGGCESVRTIFTQKSGNAGYSRQLGIPDAPALEKTLTHYSSCIDDDCHKFMTCSRSIGVSQSSVTKNCSRPNGRVCRQAPACRRLFTRRPQKWDGKRSAIEKFRERKSDESNDLYGGNDLYDAGSGRRQIRRRLWSQRQPSSSRRPASRRGLDSQ